MSATELLQTTIGHQVGTQLRITSGEGAALVDRYAPAVEKHLDNGQATVYELVRVVVQAFKDEANKTYGTLPAPTFPVRVRVAVGA